MKHNYHTTKHGAPARRGRLMCAGAFLGVLFALVFASCLPAQGFWHIDDIEKTTVISGKGGMVWKGSFAAHPEPAENGWAYYNTASKTALVYENGNWAVLTGGSAATSFFWQGNRANHAALTGTPEPGWAYYNEADDLAYIYTGNQAQYTSPYEGWDALLETGVVYFLVTFDAQGGSFVSPVLFAAESQAVEPAAPTRAGYDFAGWYADAAGITPFNFPSPPVTGPFTVYARWTAIADWAINVEDFGEENLPDTFDIYNANDWIAAVSAVNANTPPNENYVFNVWRGIALQNSSGNTSGAPFNAANPPVTRSGVTVSVRGKTGFESISLVDNGVLLYVPGGVRILLRTITIRGHGSNSAPAICVNGGNLVMKGGAAATGNSNAAAAGGVALVNNNGLFEMTDNALISGGTASYGGGVAVQEGGRLTMNGYTMVAGGTAAYGGGVAVRSAGAFTMNGYAALYGNASTSAGNGGGLYMAGSNSRATMNGESTIRANTAHNKGGGVFVEAGLFAMNGRTIIYGNTASTSHGGGVVVHGSFQMTGGTIFGDRADESFRIWRANPFREQYPGFYFVEPEVILRNTDYDSDHDRDNSATASLSIESPGTAQYGEFDSNGSFVPVSGIIATSLTFKVWNGTFYTGVTPHELDYYPGTDGDVPVIIP
ncbi:MAG: InlB B-repeat-containing protein [Spirochaetaceae bacterium]|jgi:uncharacterized repeat protein (TIGR02543 family)|nr:InlB B-repeat-containing protein [Spirochaetaceae bacterium]